MEYYVSFTWHPFLKPDERRFGAIFVELDDKIDGWGGVSKLNHIVARYIKERYGCVVQSEDFEILAFSAI